MSLSGAPHSSILDVGCGTGELSMELANSFNHVIGIDLDEAMLAKARADASKRDNIEFLHMNMLDIHSRFSPRVFDAILCFGNTLVHLENIDTISDFFKQSRSLLRKEGKLMLQIINYDRILDLGIKFLPTIETRDIMFVRNYKYLKDSHLIEFETILTVKSTNQMIKNHIHLYPLRKCELESLLDQTGFRTLDFYGNFDRDPLKTESIPMLIEASS